LIFYLASLNVLKINVGKVSYGSVVPSDQLAYIGDHAIVECFSATLVTWSDETGKIIYSASKKTNELEIRKLKKGHSGYYVCHGTTLDQKRFKVPFGIWVGGKSHNFYL